MPWEKQFNVDETLDKAMRSFWSKGYAATPLEVLVADMGIKRGSIYATYGDKRSLFIESLRRYEERYRKDFLKAVARDRSPREVIFLVFKEAVDAALSDDSRNGCFLVNTALELAPHDSEIAAIVSEGLLDTERFFRRVIRKGQKTGEISPDLDGNSVARALLGLMSGLRVLARARPEAKLLRAIQDQACVLLG